MKKTMMACAAVLAVGGAVAAENNVTIYGVADAYVGRTSTYQYTGFDLPSKSFIVTRSNQMVVDSGGLSDSRIGIRAQEDLGAGTMGFVIYESGLNLDTGAGAGARTTVVGLKSAFGTFSLGRQASPYHDTFSAFSAQNDSRFDAARRTPISIASLTDIAAFRADVNNTLAVNPALLASALAGANSVAGSTGAWVGYTERANNSIRYDSPDYNGFSGSAIVGLGENRATGVKASYHTGFSVKYASGPLALTLAHQTEANQAIANPLVAIVPAGGLIKLSNTLVAGAYDLGAAKLHAGFNVAKYNFAGAKNQKEFLLGATVPMGATTLVAQYARSQGNGKSNSFGLEAHYALSKRSTAYGGFNMTKLPSYKNSTIGAGLRHVF